MNCHHCGKGDQKSLVFCTHCGVRVAPSCPSCGTIFDSSARFCGTCGIAIPGAGCFAVDLKTEGLLKVLKAFYSCDEAYYWLDSLCRTMTPLEPAKLPAKALDAYRCFGSPAIDLWVRDSHFLEWEVISVGEDNRLILNSICFDRLGDDELAFAIASAAASIEGGFGEYLTARKFFGVASAGRLPVREQTEMLSGLRDDFILMAQAADARALQVTGNLKSAIFTVIKYSKCSRHFDASIDIYEELNDRKDIRKVDILAGRNLGKLALLVEGDFEAFSRIKRLESFYKTRDFFLGRASLKVHPYLNLSRSALVSTRNLCMDATGSLKINTANKVTIIIDRHGNHYTEVKPPVDYFRYDSVRTGHTDGRKHTSALPEAEIREGQGGVAEQKKAHAVFDGHIHFSPASRSIKEKGDFSAQPTIMPADLDLSLEIEIPGGDDEDSDLDNGLLIRGSDGIYYPRRIDIAGVSLEYDSMTDEDEVAESDREESESTDSAGIDSESEIGFVEEDSELADIDVLRVDEEDESEAESRGPGTLVFEEEEDEEDAGSSVFQDFDVDSLGVVENDEVDPHEVFNVVKDGYVAPWEESGPSREADPDEEEQESCEYSIDAFLDSIDVEPNLKSVREAGDLDLADGGEEEFSLDGILDTEEIPEEVEVIEEVAVEVEAVEISIPPLEFFKETHEDSFGRRDDESESQFPPAILVVDTGNNRVQAFDENFKFLFSIGQKGSEPGQFDTPKKLAVDRRGNVLVSDFVNCRVQKFDFSGRHLLSFGSPGSGPGEFNYPMGLDTDRNSNVYVVDAWNNRVQVFDEEGKFLLKFGEYGDKPGQFNSPNGICIGFDGLVYVTDSGNNRVQIFKSDGDFVREFGRFGSGNKPSEFDTPSGLAIDSTGKVHVADTGNNRIQVFDPSGTFIRAFGSWGDEEGCLDTPNGICIDSRDRVLIADTWNHRVQVFDLTGTYESSIGSYGSGEGFFIYASDVQSPGT